MNKKVLFLLGCLLVAVFIVSRLSGSDDENTPKSGTLATADYRDIEIKVRITGVLQAAKAHMISSELRGTEGKIIYLIGDGVQVKKGDVLVRLDPSPFEDEKNRQQTEVASYSAALEAANQLFEWEKSELKQQISTAEYNLKVAKLELTRLINGDGPLQLTQYKDEMDKAALELGKYETYVKDLKELRQKGFDNPAEIAQAEEKLSSLREKFNAAKKRTTSYEKYVLPSMEESARAKVQNAELALRQSKQAGVHTIAKSAAAVQQVESKLQAAKAALRLAEVELEKTVIRAPFDGLVIHYEAFRDGQQRKPREGDMVIMNQPILYLPDISKMEVQGLVREVDLHKIAIGQQASITVEAYPDTAFTGSLSFIGALATRRNNRQQGEKYFQVTFAVKNPDKRLRPGMTANVEVLSALHKHVLSLPVNGVFQERGETVCYCFDGRRFKRQVVTTGVQNEDFVAIADGLDEGDQVSLVKPKTMQNQ